VARGILRPLSRSSTTLASPTGILLASKALISCTAGEYPALSESPSTASAGVRHFRHRRQYPRLRCTVISPNREVKLRSCPWDTLVSAR